MVELTKIYVIKHEKYAVMSKMCYFDIDEANRARDKYGKGFIVEELWPMKNGRYVMEGDNL